MVHVTSLPPELLNSIFLSIQESTPFARRVDRLPEIIFSRVSRSWRHIALSNPLLWRRIVVDSYDSFPRIDLYLSRSKGCLVNVYLRVYCLDKSASSPLEIAHFLDRTMQSILPHIHKFRVLVIETRYGATMDYILSFLEGKTAINLESVSLDVHMGVAEIVGAEPPKPFPCSLPALRKFQCANLARSWPTLTHVVSLSFLSAESNLPGISISESTLLSICASAEALNTLSVDTSSIQESTGPMSTITLPSLRCLRVIGSGDNAHRVLWMFDAPALMSLWLELSSFWMIGGPIGPTADKPKFPSVRYLTMQVADIPKHALLSQHLPNVTHIHISYCWAPDRALSSLFRDASRSNSRNIDPSVLEYPNLSTIVLRNIEDDVGIFAHSIYDTCSVFKVATGRRLRLLTDRGGYKFLSSWRAGAGRIEWNTLVNLDLLTESNFEDPWWKLVNDDYEEKIFP